MANDTPTHQTDQSLATKVQQLIAALILAREQNQLASLLKDDGSVRTAAFQPIKIQAFLKSVQ